MFESNRPIGRVRTILKSAKCEGNIAQRQIVRKFYRVHRNLSQPSPNNPQAPRETTLFVLDKIRRLFPNRNSPRAQKIDHRDDSVYETKLSVPSRLPFLILNVYCPKSPFDFYLLPPIHLARRIYISV